MSGGCERDTGGTAGARDQDATEEVRVTSFAKVTKGDSEIADENTRYSRGNFGMLCGPQSSYRYPLLNYIFRIFSGLSILCCSSLLVLFCCAIV